MVGYDCYHYGDIPTTVVRRSVPPSNERCAMAYDEEELTLTCSSFPPLWPFLALYLTWVYIDKAPEHGGRSSEWSRSSIFWRYFADYYPASWVFPLLLRLAY